MTTLLLKNMHWQCQIKVERETNIFVQQCLLHDIGAMKALVQVTIVSVNDEESVLQASQMVTYSFSFSQESPGID